MVGTLDEFRSQFVGGGARPNQFKVEILAPPGISTGLDSRNASFLAKAASLPALTIPPIEVPFRGRKIYIAGDREFADEWTVTFLNDTNFGLRDSLERWNHGINELDTGRGVTVSSDYQADLTVQQLDRDDKVLKTYVFKDCWPTSVGAIELNTETVNTIEEFEVSWRYNHFTSSNVVTGTEVVINSLAGAT